LFADVTGNGVVPLHFIRHLKVEWNYDYRTDRDIKHMEILIKTSMSIPITLNIFLKCWRLVPTAHLPRVLAHKLGTFRPIYEALLEQGHILGLREVMLNRDLMDFYQLPTEDWILMMEAELEVKGN
jgi:hypothetical protein